MGSLFRRCCRRAVLPADSLSLRAPIAPLSGFLGHPGKIRGASSIADGFATKDFELHFEAGPIRQMGDAVLRILPLAEASALHAPDGTEATAVVGVEDSCGRVDDLLEVGDFVDGFESFADGGVAEEADVEGCREVDGVVAEKVLESQVASEMAVVDGVEGVVQIGGRGSHVNVLTLLLSDLFLNVSVRVVS